MRIALILLTAMILSCAPLGKLQDSIQAADDRMVTMIVDQIQKDLERAAREAERNASEEAWLQLQAAQRTDVKVVNKSAERLEPIIKKAMAKITPAIQEAVHEVKAQVREEILEELTGKEINQACPTCPAKVDTTVKE